MAAYECEYVGQSLSIKRSLCFFSISLASDVTFVLKLIKATQRHYCLRHVHAVPVDAVP